MIKLTYENVENALQKVLNQTEEGKVKIGNEEFGVWTYFVQLSTENASINEGEIAVKLPNKDVFIEKIRTYLEVATKFYHKDKEYFELDDESFCEKLILDLFVNATNFNLNNVLDFIEIRTKMLKQTDLTLKESVVGQFQGCDIVIANEKNKSNLEGPYRFKVSLQNSCEKFVLPSITFGCVGDELTIYCIQGEKEKQTNKLSKQMDRLFRKANKDVDMEDEILSQVSVSALVSLTIFLTYQKAQGLNGVKAVNFMPIRYNSNLTSGTMRAKTEQDKIEFEEVHNRNQFNISNRFFNTLIRYAHHFDVEIVFDDIREELNFKLTQNENSKDNILYDIQNAIKDNETINEI